MRKRKFFIPSIGAAIMLLTTTGAFAHPMPVKQRCMCRCRPIMMKRFKSHHQMIFLKRRFKKLAPEQKATVRKIFKETRTKIAPVRHLLVAKRAELKAALLEPKLNTQRIQGLEKEIISLRSQIFKSRIGALVRIKQEIRF